jgi:hypothetical protein
MLRSSSCSRAFALALLFIALSAAEAHAHCFVGPRFFPATLAIDDPCVADEMSLPTVGWSKTGDVPAATEWDISVELSKRITEDFGISVGDTWSNIHQPGGFTKAGFSNLETTLQYQLLKDGPHELALLLGLIVDWGGAGAVDSGLATPWSTLTPTFYFGKGLGDLPDSFGWVRAFAVTGQIGYQVPTRSFDIDSGSFIPQVLFYGAGGEVGTYFQVGAEAVLPVNHASGTGVGFLGQLHLYLDDMFPTTIGRPLLGGSSAPPQQVKF